MTVTRRVGRRAAIAATVVLAVALWWAWPSLAGHDDRLGVLVVADEAAEAGRRSVELRAREAGRSVRWESFDEAWCAEPAALTRLVDEHEPERVVLAAGVPATCAEAIGDAVDGAIAVVQPGEDADAVVLADAGFRVVDPERLVGRPGDDPRRSCQWWETCEGDGRIAVRDGDGTLTEAGHERVARMVVASL